MYDQVIIDSAVFKNRLSQKAKDFILSHSAVLSQTFFDETKDYEDTLKSTSLKYNLHDLITMSKTKGLRLYSPESFDVLQKAKELSKQNLKVCVITEDELLIERLLSGYTPVDVYDLNKDTLIQFTHCKCPCYMQTSACAELVEDIRAGFSVKLQNGTSLTLAGYPKGGREGEVYDVAEHKDTVAKIYKHYPSVQHKQHLEALKAIGEKAKLPWCVFPKELLYYNDRLVGFTMPKADFTQLSADALYLENPLILNEEKLSIKRSHTLKFCLKLLMQIKILNSYGIAVSDVNDANFSTYKEDEPIIMIDTDSFVLGNNFNGTVGEDKHFSRKYDLKNKEQVLLQCEEGALKLVFKLLSLGTPPFGKDSAYLFESTKSPNRWRSILFPSNVLDYLNDVFTAKVQPSISIAIDKIRSALKYLEAHPDKDITVKEMYESPDPFTVSEQEYDFKPSPKQPAAASGKSDLLTNSSADTSTEKKVRKHRLWPWLLLTILGGAAYYLISNNIIPL